MVSLVLHDHDNEHGVPVVNELGQRWTAFGDGKLFEPSDGASSRMTSFDMAILAVRLGNADIELAYEMGRSQKQQPMPPRQIYDQVRQQPVAPAKAGGNYGAEQILPRVDPDAKMGAFQWKAKDIKELWTTPIRKGAAVTFGELVHQSMNSGMMGSELAKISGSLPETQDPFLVSYGSLYPQAAFRRAVLSRIATPESCLAYFLEIATE